MRANTPITDRTTTFFQKENRGAALELDVCCLVAIRMYIRLPFELESSTTAFRSSENQSRQVLL
uniref:Uncharacterized protein n=1 Tax=Arundo donax TaxID=35708 RepID=A0A0A8ZPK0_ARUDO